MLKTPIIFFILATLLVTPVFASHLHDSFATGDPTLAPNPIPSACSSRCPPILIQGPTFGPAITFSQNNSITGKVKVLLGPTPFNVTLTSSGACLLNQAAETPIPIGSFGSIAPLQRNIQYLYCLYYHSLPAATSYSLEVTFKHPGDTNFIQTITWAIP